MTAIWIRRTVDWADEEAVFAQLPAELEAKVALWDATFTMRYTQFRHRVAQIAAANHAAVEGARVARWDAIAEGELVLPVDDDDWFAPGTARVLERAAAPAATCYLWPSRWIEVPIDLGHRLHLARRRLFPRTPPMWVCTTNNYALVKGPETLELAASHIAASRWFDDGGASATQRLDATLSVANRTLASITTLGQASAGITRGELVRKLRRHRRLYDRPLAAELAWCRPFVQQMSELMRELELKR